MYFYLGIVAEEDLRKGYIIPSYILCQSHGTSERRSGWRVTKQNEDNPMRNMNKVLVTSLLGHDDMIDFLCAYRTRDHMHGDKHYKHHQTKKYYPKGGMFWFECNQYGEPCGSALFIMRVPVGKKNTDSGFTRLKEAQQKEPSLIDLLSNEISFEDNPTTSMKAKLVQRREPKCRPKSKKKSSPSSTD